MRSCDTSRLVAAWPRDGISALKTFAAASSFLNVLSGAAEKADLIEVPWAASQRGVSDLDLEANGHSCCTHLRRRNQIAELRSHLN